MIAQIPQLSSALAGLRKRWAALLFAAALFLVIGYALLHAWWQPGYALRWLVIASGFTAFLSWTLWTGLPYNHRPGETWLLPSLGTGNYLTLLRGLFIAALAGFLFSPLPDSWLAWLPGTLYTCAALADLFDGYLARRANHATGLGERLDMYLDGLGLLIAVVLIVQYGQVPAWYLLVGFARYLFLAGTWLRKRRKLPVYDLGHSPSRRPLAGAQMGFVAVMLWPLFSPPGTHLAAALFALPFLLGFGLDWLSVSGISWPGWLELRNRPGPGDLIGRRIILYFRSAVTILRPWAPVLLRLTVVSLLIASVELKVSRFRELQPAISSMEHGLIIFLLITGTLMLALGAAGRVGALAVLFATGLQQRFVALSGQDFFLIACLTVLFFLGTGLFSLWTPENRLIERRLGEMVIQDPLMVSHAQVAQAQVSERGRDRC